MLSYGHPFYLSGLIAKLAQLSTLNRKILGSNPSQTTICQKDRSLWELIPPNSKVQLFVLAPKHLVE